MFAVIAIAAVWSVLVPLALITSGIKLNNSMEFNSDNEWSISSQHETIDGKIFGLQYTNGNFTFSFELPTGIIAHALDFSTETMQIGYLTTSTFEITTGLSYSISTSADGVGFSISFVLTGEIGYNVEISGGNVTHSVEIGINGLSLTLEQTGLEFGFVIGIAL